jgi:N-sulfoglucosamine sulfohydrolase
VFLNQSVIVLAGGFVFQWNEGLNTKSQPQKRFPVMPAPRARTAHWWWLGLGVVLSAVMSAVAEQDAGKAVAPGLVRPNILLIVSEDNGPELGCYGEPSVKTPVLDALASKGVLFERAYVPQAGCSQSRAALLTGLYPHQNGQIGLATWKFRLYHDNTPNLVRSLQKAGYRTGIIGKLHVSPASAFPFDFKEIESSNFSRNKLGKYAREAGKFINASKRPFFLSVNYPDAHRPFIREIGGIPEKPLTGDDVKPLSYFGLDTPELRQETADYYNCMSRLDTQIGELLTVLRKSGKLSNTLVVYIGDHGADMLRGKRTSYEGGVRIPFILSWAGRWGAGRRHLELVSTLDLMPTFLHVAGIPQRKELPGRSLVPLLDGEAVDWREYLFTEFHLHSAHNYYPQRTVRDDRFKLICNLMPGTVNPGYEFTHKRFFKGLDRVIAAAKEPVRSAYLRMRSPPEYELYDLKRDPYEFENLADDPEYGGVLQKMKSELMRWRRSTGDPLLDRKNILRLKSEIEACMTNKDGSPNKARLSLSYPEYFFRNRNEFSKP